MEVISGAGEFLRPGDGSDGYLTHLVSADLSVGTYSLPVDAADDQSPHSEDEIYVVTSGRATLVADTGTAEVGPGSVIFVPAGEGHRFTSVTEDLALLVIFAPPYGSRSLPAVLGAALAGELVGALIAGVTGVTLDPFPVNVVAVHRLGEPAPQVGVLHWLLRRGQPPVALPALDPLRDPAEHVGAVRVQGDRDRALEGLQRHDGRHQFHPVIRGGWLAAMHLPLLAVGLQQRTPAARSG